MIDWLIPGGRAGNVLREFKWSSTSLGPLDTWPQSLRTAVNFMLAAQQPVYIAWGAELLSMYNDSYLPIVGEKHPNAMGKPFKDLWAEIWEEYRPHVEAVMGGEAKFWVDQPFVLEARPNHPVGWFTVSWTPLRDEQGLVAGFLSVGTESTERVLSDMQLVESIDEGYCILEIVQDKDSRPIDYRFIRTNRAFEQQTGLKNAEGKLITELVQNIERHWIEVNGNVALTGQPLRFVDQSLSMGRWFDCYTFPIAGSKTRVGSLFRDITVQKRHEDFLEKSAARQAFSLELEDALRNLQSPEEIIEAACRMLGQRIGASRVVYGEVDESQRFVFMRRDWTCPGVASVAGATKIMNDFGPELIADLQAGKVIVNVDVKKDHRTAQYANAYSGIGVRAELLLPFIKSTKLRLVLAFHRSTPHQWTIEEVEAGKDMAQRTWSAVEAITARAQFRTEHDRSQAVFDTMAEGFGMLDANWTVLYMNAEGLRIGNRPGQQIVGSNHWELWPHTVGTPLESMYRRVMRTREPESIEFQHPYMDGDVGWLEVRVYPGLDDGLSVFFRDINSRKEAEQKLLHADRRKDEFLAMLAHELRNPLAPIGAAAQLLQLGKLEGERVKKTSEVIGRQVSHMTGLIDDLLDVSRVTSGLIQLDKVTLDIANIVNDAVEQVNPLIRARRHELIIRHGSQAIMICGDKKRLVQVLANVLNNAAKYTGEGGHLLLCTSVHESNVLIEVTDDGVGMTPEMVTHAFDLFSQAERTSDRASGGLGLGLSLVKSLVMLHGGTVSCKSDGLGKGSTFSVCLPLLGDNVHFALGDSVGGSSAASNITPLRILVVDDNIDAAEMLKLVLETLGHVVTTENGAYRALETAKRYRPDVCLLDIGLPEIDGNELARRLRAQPETRNAMLIAVTGYGRDDDKLKSIEAGFDRHLVKPIDIPRLCAIFSELKSA